MKFLQRLLYSATEELEEGMGGEGSKGARGWEGRANLQKVCVMKKASGSDRALGKDIKGIT